MLHLEVHLAELVRQHGPWIYAILFAIIFAETGLVVTPILPGDSLLFVAGTLAATGEMDVHLLVALLVVAAILGGYYVQAGRQENAGFFRMTVPGRIRLGYGTNHLRLARGVEAKRNQIGLHVAEIIEALEHTAPIEDAGVHPDYGPLVQVTGITGAGRGVRLTVQADRLPMTLVDLTADVEAPLVPHDALATSDSVTRSLS